MQKFYITTTLPYVNADPHIGFALEIVQADIIARYRRLMGDDVFFNTGTDEHGQKVLEKALEEKKNPQEYVDEYAKKFDILKKALNLSYDAFIRTTDEAHKAAAQELWKRCEANGDIYKKKYKGLYCVGDEMFLRDSDLVDGRCPNHLDTEPIEIEEENWFFKLSNYESKLLEYLDNDSSILPNWRREEAINFIKNGLEDLSISRDKERLSWGMPVPDDDTQVMYVWFDALTNYISTLGWPEDKNGNFKKFWEGGKTLQVAGKDQIRFQSIIWQAMLLSAGLPTTNTIFYHGFITSDGHKMSKSLGNVVDPFMITEDPDYGTDALRYYLARHVHPFEDSDFTMEKFKKVYNANLANGLGNLVARVMKMAESYGVSCPDDTDSSFTQNEYLGHFHIHQYMDKVWADIKHWDEYIQKQEPFKKIKGNEEGAKKDIKDLLVGIRMVARALEPVMPETAEKIQRAIKENKKPETLFPRKD